MNMPVIDIGHMFMLMFQFIVLVDVCMQLAGAAVIGMRMVMMPVIMPVGMFMRYRRMEMFVRMVFC